MDSSGRLDIWFNPTNENFKKIIDCFKNLGYDTSEIENSNKELSETVIRLPLESFYIELLPFLDGKNEFYPVYHRAKIITVNEIKMKVICYDDLIESKANVHRAKDLEDIAQLEKRKEQRKKNLPNKGLSFE
jgi:predicted nucleotidyltransferase